ncbi:MAG: hypothetical protein KA998_04310 [Rickettsiaceae bacterium]|nr:hypothetical protein [Rickettsiaceae bacterium]
MGSILNKKEVKLMNNKKEAIIEISSKNTKDQILAAYNDVLMKLSEKQSTPQEQKRQEEVQDKLKKTTALSTDNILSELSSLKSKAIKQIDSLSGELLEEFQKLINIQNAISIEQQHLKELYQINKTANSLSALLQAQAEEKERFKSEMDQIKQKVDQEMENQRLYWKERKEKLEQEHEELKEQELKARKREEEEYNYVIEQKRKKELDEYNGKKLAMEKELSEIRIGLQKREDEIVAKEKDYDLLKKQVEDIPSVIREASLAAEGSLRSNLIRQHDIDTKLREQEYRAELQLKDQNISHLEEKIAKQESMIKEVTAKANMAVEQVQKIACRALDASAQRFVGVSGSKLDDSR